MTSNMIGYLVVSCMSSKMDTYIYTCMYTNKMNIKTNILEGYVNFVDSTKKQNKYLTRIKTLFMVSLCLFFCFFLNI